MGKVFLAFLLAFLFAATPALAIDPPTQTSPANGATVTGTTMQWEVPSYTLYDGDHYRVQVDNDQTFVSIDKDYNTENSSYSPTGLTETTWYWRVKAKDSSGTWSDWSSIWNFILTTPTPTPTPTPTNTPTPTPEPTSTPTPTPTGSPTNTPIPTPTKTPTPAKTPTPIKTPTPNQSLRSGSGQASAPTPDSNVQLPPSILGTTSAEISPTPGETLVKSQDSPLKNLYLIGGGLVLILTGVLFSTFIAKGKSKKI